MTSLLPVHDFTFCFLFICQDVFVAILSLTFGSILIKNRVFVSCIFFFAGGGVGRVHPEVVASHSEVFFYLIFIYIFQYCHFSSFFYFVNCVTLCFCCFLLLPFRFSLKFFILHIFCSFSHIPPNVAIFENFENIFRLHFVSKDEEVGLYSIVQ